MEKVCTLTELDTHYDLDDVMRANAYLDMKYHYEKLKADESKNK